ncbi:hypothetical protein F2P81_023133 [Scophthalmus maximus]|uniref:Uncharacterized protein n=1 Tax=Scophthalmus maximus TaxID=52904 RepID=A0A6A4RZB2_SCOMX|nr:hypothetical protein F2P81_023133 [Scophthalmus maximus]
MSASKVSPSRPSPVPNDRDNPSGGGGGDVSHILPVVVVNAQKSSYQSRVHEITCSDESQSSVHKSVGHRRDVLTRHTLEKNRRGGRRWRSKAAFSRQSPALWAPLGQGPISRTYWMTDRWMPVADLPLTTTVGMRSRQARETTER